MDSAKPRILPVEEGSDSIQSAYDIETEQALAQGGFSSVWAAAEKETGDLVAIKKIAKYIENEHHSWAEDEKLIQREFRNLQLVAGHPHVVELLTYYEDDEFIYLVFELLLGGELFDLILENQYPEAECRLIVTQIVEAIEWCHEQHIVHRDIKPENLMAEGDGIDRLKLIDFGLSVYLPEGEKSDEQAGSPGYVAPELIKSIPYDRAVDMWSLGVTCYVICVGFMPWDEESPDLSVKAQIEEACFNFEAVEWSNFSAEAQNFITRCLTVDPQQRMTAKQARQHPWITGGTLAPLPAIPPLTISEDKQSPVITPRESHTPRLKPHPKDPAHYQLIAHLIEKASRLGEKSTFCHSTPEHTPKPAHREYHETKRRSHQDDDDVELPKPLKPSEPRIAMTPEVENLQKGFQSNLEQVNKRASVQDGEIPSEAEIKARMDQETKALREKAEQEEAERKRLAEKAEQERLEARKAERARLAALEASQKADQERLAALEAQLQAAQKAEKEKLETERAEREKLAALEASQKADQERLAALEAQLQAKALEAEQERLAIAAQQAKLDKVKQANLKAEQEKIAAEKLKLEQPHEADPAQLRPRNPLHKNPELTGQDIADEDSPLVKKQKQDDEPKGVCPCLNDCTLF